MQLQLIRSKALGWLLAVSGLALACGDDSNPPPSADSTGGTGDASSTSGNTITATSLSSVSADSTGAVDSSSTGMADGSFLDPSTSTGEAPVPQPNGSPCDVPADCETEFCYEIPMLGGVCSECLTDEDCGEGTCAIDFMLGYGVCTDGALGLMCNTDEGCMGDLVCTQLIDTMGFFPDEFCSECRDDDVPCADMNQICTPVYDLANFQGYHGCVDPGTVENGGGCPLDAGGMGDGTVCVSGLCGVANLIATINVGVCGECLDDTDCMPMQTCQPPSADLQMGITPAVCM